MNTPNEQPNKPVGEFLHKYKDLCNDFPVPHSVVENERFIAYKPSFKVVYFYLAHLANRFATKEKEGWFFMSCRNLSKRLGLDIKTIRAAKKQLVKDGFLEFKEGGFDPSKKTRNAGLYRVWGGEVLSKQVLPVDSQNQPENQQDYEENYDEIYGR